ncbi:MAG: Gfo/Idh/MocA family oxidoreductase [Nitrospiraceae bacterium]
MASLGDLSVNAVVIGTRHDSHARLAVKALEAGKHVFIEKPLCLTEEELDAIRAVYEDKAQKGLTLTVGFNCRFSACRCGEKVLRGERIPVMTYRVNAGKSPRNIDPGSCNRRRPTDR